MSIKEALKQWSENYEDNVRKYLEKLQSEGKSTEKYEE
jgi:hypothetical protein